MAALEQNRHMECTTSEKVLLPFIIKEVDGTYNVPIGDGIMMLPIATELNQPVYLPNTFRGNLIADLYDGKRVCELTSETSVDSTMLDLFNSTDHPLAMKNWGSDELINRFGPLNATLCIALAMGIDLKDPVPKLTRPANAISGRVIIFPKGSVPTRSMSDKFYSELSTFLKASGYDVLSGDHVYDNPLEYATFIASAEYVISTFTGPMHVASAMGVKTIALPIGDSPFAYRPLQPKTAVLASNCDRCWFKKHGRACGENDYSYCQQVISPEAVRGAMGELDAGEENIFSLFQSSNHPFLNEKPLTNN